MWHVYCFKLGVEVEQDKEQNCEKSTFQKILASHFKEAITNKWKSTECKGDSYKMFWIPLQHLKILFDVSDWSTIYNECPVR